MSQHCLLQVSDPRSCSKQFSELYCVDLKVGVESMDVIRSIRLNLQAWGEREVNVARVAGSVTERASD